MIKPMVVLGVMVFLVMAFGVFEVESRVQSMRNELASLNKQIKNDKEAIHVLKAEWTYLNKPDRLKEMSQRYLDLDMVTIEQVKDVKSAPLRGVMVSSLD